MTLPAGSHVGPYVIGSAIGAGGMGEVYRANDTKLGRDVAIKVLPAAFAEDRERVARFRREAQLLASLNHPNIASIYGLEEADGTPSGSGDAPPTQPPKTLALVLELAEGEDLAQRLSRGAIPVDEVIAIARQIAAGLEAAHEKGIVHRDLKPANVKLTKDGSVKILDFGLAKAYEGGGQDALDSGLTQSPTMSRHETSAGVILGTAVYMSPEQARGRPVDKRSDIWSFGVVVLEMLTGKRLFAGETVTDVLAAVLTREPDLSTLPAGTPSGVRQLLSRCLERDARRRLRDIGEARIALDEPARVDELLRGSAAAPRSRLTRALPWATATAAIVVAIWALSRSRGESPSPRDVVHVEIGFPAGVEPVTGRQGGVAIAPDGTAVAMVGFRDGVRRLFVRRLNAPEAVEVSDTAGCGAFSPDSTSLAFVRSTTALTRVSLADGQQSTLSTASDFVSGVGIAWGPKDVVYTRGGVLWSVPASGGAARQLTTLDSTRAEVLHSDPLALPGGRTVLFSCLTTEQGTERIEAIPVEGGKRSTVVERATTPVWSPTGHLLFGRDGAVWAVPFDAAAAQSRGSAVRVIPAGVVGTVRTGSLGFQVSISGTLVFIPSNFGSKRLVSVGRDGSELALALPASSWASPRISPDGRLIALERDGNVVESVDLSRGTRAFVAASALGTNFPIWTSDGANLLFRRFNVPFWAAADGSGKAGAVPLCLLNDSPSSPGPDSDSFIAVRIQPETAGDIFLISISGRFPPKPLVSTPAYEGSPHLSPDRRWLVYQSNASGQPEIYVRRYPELDRAWQVSGGGGVQVRWNPSGREIHYRGGGHVMAVAFDASGKEPSFGKPVAQFPDEYDFGQGISVPNYDVTRDGRFLMLRRGSQGGTLRAVLNWTEELKGILAEGGVR